MTLNRKLIKLWDEYFSKIADGLSKINVLLIAGLFYLVVYAGYSFFSETELIETPTRLIYFLVTVATTIGFGDFSPTTEGGQLFTVFFVMPLSLGLFALVGGKLVARLASIWYRKVKGMHTVKYENHIVLLGYNRDRTPLLVKQILREDKRKVVLVSVEQVENPMPEFVEFVSVPSFTNATELCRSGLDSSSCIIVDTDSDENTLTISLFVSALNKDAHLVAHFTDNVKGQILKQQCMNAEIISNLSTELLAKSVMDSGSSLVHSELVSAEHGQTQYSIVVGSKTNFSLSAVFMEFKVQTEATIIGLRRKDEDEVHLNINLNETIYPGDTLYYISDERIDFEQWPN